MSSACKSPSFWRWLMADGFSRALGRLSSCNGHVAPGLGNAMGSLFNAAWSHSPVIVSAGQQEQGNGLTEPLLYGPLVPMASPIAKWAYEITRVEDIPRVVRRAAKIALTRSQAQVREALGEFDLMVALGADVLRMSVWSPVEVMPDGLSVVHLGQHDWDMGKNHPAEMAVRADLLETLKALIHRVRELRSADQTAVAQARVNALAKRCWRVRRKSLEAAILERPASTPIHPDRVMLEVVKHLPDNAIVVDEGLTSTRNLPALYPYRERHDFYGLDSGGIGFAIAGSIGIQLAHPDRLVTAVIGDGSAHEIADDVCHYQQLQLPHPQGAISGIPRQ
jgi:benzoylformate decarboxylase